MILSAILEPQLRAHGAGTQPVWNADSKTPNFRDDRESKCDRGRTFVRVDRMGQGPQDH